MSFYILHAPLDGKIDGMKNGRLLAARAQLSVILQDAIRLKKRGTSLVMESLENAFSNFDLLVTICSGSAMNLC